MKGTNKSKLLKSKTKPEESSVVSNEKPVNLSPGLIGVYHYPTGRFVFVSYAIYHTLGYSSDDLLKGGLDFLLSIIHPDDYEGSIMMVQAANKLIENYKLGIDDSKLFVSYEYRARHKDGHWVWLNTFQEYLAVHSIE